MAKLIHSMDGLVLVEGARRPNVNGQSVGTPLHALKDHDLIELGRREDGILHQVLSPVGL